MAQDEARTSALADRGMAKARRVEHKRRLRGVLDGLRTLLRLLRAWATRRYRAIPWRALIAALAGVIYFVNPIDLVPDFIPLVGFIDDAAVLAFVLRSIASDLRAFTDWEATQTTAPGATADTA